MNRQSKTHIHFLIDITVVIMIPISHYFQLTSELKVHALIWNFEHLKKAKPCVLLHGFSQDAHIWDGLANRLIEDFASSQAPSRAIVALDFRGHGDSDWDNKLEYNHPTLLSDLISVVDALGLEQFDVVGHSLGARVGILYTANYLNRVTSLTIIDVGPEVAAATVAKIRQDADATPAIFQSVDDYILHMGRLYFLADRTAIENYARWGLKLNEKDQLIPKTDPKFTTALWSEEPIPAADPAYVYPFNDNLWSYLPQLKLPTLLVRGALSAVLTKAKAEEMINDSLPTARLVTIPAAGHTVMLDNAGSFESTVSSFLLQRDFNL